MSPLDLSLVLACYNEEPILVQSVHEIVSVLEVSRFTYELIFVDDGSRDRTRELIAELREKYGTGIEIRALFHERNVGRGGAVRDGMLMSRGEVVGFIDVDLEVHARYIIPCLLAIRQGADIASAKRIYKFQWRSLDRYLMSKGYAWMVKRLLRLPGITDTEAGFKFFQRAKLLPILEHSQETGWFWDTEIVALAQVAGLVVVEVPCLYIRRFDKASSVRPLHDSLEYLVKLCRFRTRLRELRREGAWG